MSLHIRHSLLYWPSSVIWLVITMILSGCSPIGVSNYQGGDGLMIELPFPAGTQKMCTQGAHGTHSHDTDSTRYDIDLDTHNSVDEELFAPVSGVAYVHMESATSGFGYHVNIDLGDGTYVVIAHLSDIFVSDGDEVAVGQLLGYEGKTGNATGDHVHIGLHEGVASQSADHGTSIPATYWAGNASTSSDLQAIDSESFVCGIQSEGDPQDGDFYESGLAITLWHPDGTLVKTPDNARVYLLEDGGLRWIQNEDVFWGMGYSFDEVALISQEEMACLGTGADITSAQPVTSYGSMRQGDLVKESDASDVYAVSNGYALPIQSWDVYLLMGFGDRTITTLSSGAVEAALSMGNCAADIYCLDHEAITTCGGGMDLTGGSGSGGDSSDQDSSDQQDDEPEEEDVVDDEEEEEDNDQSSTLTVEVDYPSSYPKLELTVQPIYAVSSLGDYWSASESVTNDDDVSWSQDADFDGLLGVRLNVNVDSDGNGSYDDWYCYGHYSSASLEYGVAVDITLGADSWDENDLVTWSPGEEDQTELGCSALLWFGSTSNISEGYVQ